MKIFLAGLVFCVACLSGCASKDNSYYERAIKASEKAHDKFDKE